ncbi:hypothetical protein GEMRC1_000403 [Eukaryota sp. GEM-RC1]
MSLRLPEPVPEESQTFEDSQQFWLTSQTPPVVVQRTSSQPVAIPYTVNPEIPIEYQPTEEKKAYKPGDKKGISQLTHDLVLFLQRNGSATLQELEREAGIDYRRGYEILQILVSIGVVEKIRESCPEGKEHIVVFNYLGGDPIDVPLPLKDIVTEVERRQVNILYLDKLNHRLDQMINSKDEKDPFDPELLDIMCQVQEIENSGAKNEKDRLL